METQTDNNYKGFDLDEYTNEEKAKALIDCLDLDSEETELVENGDYYEVNPSIKKSGRSPAEAVRDSKLLKKILTPKKIKQIQAIIHLDVVSKEVRDKVYYSVTRYINKYKKGTEEFKKLSMFNAYASNVVYHLLDKDGQDHALTLQEAFIDETPKDRRNSYGVNDGEYWVLDDTEADDRAYDYLTGDTYLYKESVAHMIENGDTTPPSLIEWAEDVISQDGRGSVLSSYDGEELEEGDFFIYRVN